MKFICISLLFFSACSGYRFQEKNNPFRNRGINSINIPLFYNKSNISNVSAAVTKEISMMLSKFRGLRIYNARQDADAVLIGIITSRERLRDSKIANGTRSAKNAAGNLIGDNRGDFYIPLSTSVNLSLKLILLKKPLKEEIELMYSSLGKFVVSSKVVFQEVIGLGHTFTNEVYGRSGRDVIDTQNRSALSQSIDQIAKDAARNFKDMIIYAF